MVTLRSAFNVPEPRGCRPRGRGRPLLVARLTGWGETAGWAAWGRNWFMQFSQARDHEGAEKAEGKEPSTHSSRELFRPIRYTLPTGCVSTASGAARRPPAKMPMKSR